MKDMGIDLAVVLPAGEWADVKSIKPHGITNARNWAYFAQAKSIRHGMMPVFLKFLVPASASAGEMTKAFAGSNKLDVLHQRIRSIASAKEIPLVKILHSEFIENPRGLLVAMEKVEIFESLIAAHQTGIPDALNILSCFEPGEEPQWMHFDICPSNAGRSISGPVLIDPESLYLASNGMFTLEQGALAKWHRLPEKIAYELADALKGEKMHLPVDLALKKQLFEVGLLAIECVLGPLPPLAKEDRYLSESQVRAWGLHNDSPQANAIREIFVESIQSGRGLDLALLRQYLQELASEYEEGAERSESYVVLDSFEHSPSSSRIESGADKQEEFASLLRAGRLNEEQILEYENWLRDEIAHRPNDRKCWEELMLVHIAFQKDPRKATETVKLALSQFPGDTGFSRTMSLVRVWGND